MGEIEKHLEKAERYRQKGKNEDALAEYLEVLQEEPAHPVAAAAAADLHLLLGHDHKAASLLLGIFDRQVARGQRTPAMASYRKLLKIAVLTPERSLQAARFLENGNQREAWEAYQAAWRGFTAMARRADALAALRGMAAVAPAVETLRQLGELAAEMGEAQEASAAFLQAGEMEAKEGRRAPSLNLYERAYALNPDMATAIAYTRELLAEESAADAATAAPILQPYAQGPAATAESSALYGRALLALGSFREAAPYLWQMYQQDAQQVNYVARAIEGMIAAGQTSDAVPLARRLEQQQQRAGQLREHAAMMRSLAAQYPADTELLEYLVELFNAANREADYCQTLLQLFELYYAARNFLKASECLDRAAEADPYVPGHRKRLQMLQGKVDEVRLRNIAQRLGGAVTDAAKPDVTEETEEEPALLETLAGEGSTVLEDLMLQAEIFLRYAVRGRALERAERIQALFPGEELKNQRLRDLYVSLGMLKTAAKSGLGLATSGAAADDLARVTGITRNIFRQGSVKAVLFTAVNEIGRHWQASRCVAMLCTPGRPPSVALEYCGAGVPPSNVHDIVKLVGILQPLLLAHGPLTAPSESRTPNLEALKQFSAGMSIDSLLAVPLVEGEEHIGMVLLAQCTPGRQWLARDVAVVKTVADQIVQALANVRLRGMIKNLAVKEENTGLVKRSSYLEVLLSEVSRGLQQNSKLTLALLHFGWSSDAARHRGPQRTGSGKREEMETEEPAAAARLQQIGQLVSSHIRQTDIAVRYDMATVALVLPDADELSAQAVVRKFRDLLQGIRTPGGGAAPTLTAGIAEAVMEPKYDPADVVTEVINRVEAALEMARVQGDDDLQVLRPAAWAAGEEIAPMEIE
jgi:GAF domain-containing protein